MNDEQLGPVVSSWLKEENRPPSDPTASVHTAMSAATKTRQLRRWWWLPPFVHRMPDPPSEPHAVDHTTTYQPSPIPATNGHTPTAIGRTTSLLSPVKTITAGAIVFALGSAFLIAQPFGQQTSVPGAEAEAIAPTWVTGNVHYAPSCSGPDSEVDGDVRHVRNYECSPQTWTASDPRLSGEVASRWNEDVYETDNGSNAVNTTVDFLTNDEGGWTCSSNNLYEGYSEYAGPLTGKTATCVGQGGYEGLSALLIHDKAANKDESEPFSGLIFSGDFPPVPEPPAAD